MQQLSKRIAHMASAPLEIQREDPTKLFKFWLPSTFLATTLHGIVLALSISCIFTLRKASKQGSLPREWRFLQLYIALLVAISITNAISEILTVLGAVLVALRSSHVSLAGPPQGQVGIFSFVLGIWGADGFLLWRCSHMYQTLASQTLRRLVRGLLAVILMISLGCGVIYLAMASSKKFALTDGSTMMLIFSCTSLFVNLSITVLILGRIVALGHINRRSGGRGFRGWAVYAEIISIIVESAALIVIFDLAYIILTLTDNVAPMKSLGALVPLISLTQIHIIAAELVIYRLAATRNDVTNVIEDQTRTGELSFVSSHHVSSFKLECSSSKGAHSDIEIAHVK
ncbi:hypothetical protein CPB83DRAFT_859414 [Crepidotus variabilis]|uniref:Uncharacterized protein n=1 Tax=Crepidotus variabilis TaxID=179855 RepID=A0A9P6JLQ5_9AGAR|nr:hypothetical protein CPB83DRAFT_859414 [Crepidotus variabilis]